MRVLRRGSERSQLSLGAVKEETRVSIRSDQDILKAREQGRALGQRLGMSNTNLTVVATVISELTRNILLYAKRGELVLGLVERNGQQGLAVTARDRGPGIPDIESALRVGFSTSGSLGLGLPGVRRLMDDFDIVSSLGEGTTVTATKWKN